MPASADYLTKYLTASTSHSHNLDFEDSSRPKKRRKKDKHAPAASSTLLIADDDEGLLLSSQKRQADDDEDGPLVFEGRTKSAEFRKKKSSAWTSVAAENGDEQATEAERMLAEAASESAHRRAAEEHEEAPAVVDGALNAGASSGPRMSSGAKAGLQTAADTAALVAAAAEEEETRKSKKKKMSKRNDDDEQPAEETIYRDATGRRIDISLRRQEARAQEVAKIQAEKKERESAMGEVQLRQRDQAKMDLEEAKFLTLGRSAEDDELNERQKEELRWDDPMAQYMAERAAEREMEDRAKNPGSRGEERNVDLGRPGRKKKEYAGAAPPNRYGIKPGWRWDGVDRGTGFEKEWFLARGKKTRNENLEYQWQMDE